MRCVVIAALLIACGSAPPPPTTTTPDCVHVDGRGGAMADGTAAHPFANLDAALASLGARGGTICMPTGEFDPPSGAITAPVVLRGAGPAMTTISPAPGASCRVVHGVPFIPPMAGQLQDSDAVIETQASLTLSDLALSGCSIGVRALAGDLVIQRAAIGHVNAGVLVEASASAMIGTTTIVTTMATTLTVPSAGVVSAAARSILVDTGTDISGVGAGIETWNVDLDVVGAHLHDMPVGLLSAGNDATRAVHVMDTMIEHIVPTPAGGGFDVVSGGTATFERVVIRDVTHYALALDGATTTITDGSFAGDEHLVRAQGGTTTLTGANTFTGGHIALAAAAPMLTTGPSGIVHVTGTIASTGASLAHVLVDQGATLTLEAAGSTLDGGRFGLAVFRGSTLRVDAGARVRGADGPLVAIDTGTVANVTGLDAVPNLIGVLTNATTTLMGAAISGGEHAVAVLGGTTTIAGSSMLQHSTSSGVRVESGSAMLSSSLVDAAMAPACQPKAAPSR
jgi:hypothetical protein